MSEAPAQSTSGNTSETGASLLELIQQGRDLRARHDALASEFAGLKAVIGEPNEFAGLIASVRCFFGKFHTHVEPAQKG